MLPAGRDLITEQLVEVQNYRNALGGLKVRKLGFFSSMINANLTTVILASITNIVGL